MEIIVQSSPGWPKSGGYRRAILVPDNWDDFHYKTTYTLWLDDGDIGLVELGQVKIGQADMPPRADVGANRPELPRSIGQPLPPKYFSVGQDASYYENLMALPDGLGLELLRNLNDATVNPDALELAKSSDVGQTSVLRSVSAQTIEGQFRRVVGGSDRNEPFTFQYLGPSQDGNEPAYDLTFDVIPTSRPPTNVHAIVGRNGVGKTHLLFHMAHAMIGTQNPDHDFGEFVEPSTKERLPFSGLVYVAFSAFDRFEPPSDASAPTKRRSHCSYVGLRDVDAESSADAEGLPGRLKGPAQLAEEFCASVAVCLSESARRDRWMAAMEVLHSDPMFAEAGVLARLGHEWRDFASLRREAGPLFEGLSSGHKIVLLTLTRLVETVQERTLVLMDEPESHLHPPLLGALVRALSDLLAGQNGVAIIATHSPVVLQEIPRTCVYILDGGGAYTYPKHPERETFGENVGVLTHEVFGLEVTESGFYRMVRSVVEEKSSLDEVLVAFDGQLGSEGVALAQGLLNLKSRRG